MWSFITLLKIISHLSPEKLIFLKLLSLRIASSFSWEDIGDQSSDIISAIYFSVSGKNQLFFYHLSIISLSFSFYGPIAKSTSPVSWLKLNNQFVSQNHIELYGPYFLGFILVCAHTLFLNSHILISCTIPSGSSFLPTQAYTCILFVLVCCIVYVINCFTSVTIETYYFVAYCHLSFIIDLLRTWLLQNIRIASSSLEEDNVDYPSGNVSEGSC